MKLYESGNVFYSPWQENDNKLAIVTTSFLTKPLSLLTSDDIVDIDTDDRL